MTAQTECIRRLIESSLGAFVKRYIFPRCSLLMFYDINPFMPNELFYFHSLDQSSSNIWGVWLVFIITMFCRK